MTTLNHQEFTIKQPDAVKYQFFRLFIFPATSFFFHFFSHFEIFIHEILYSLHMFQDILHSSANNLYGRDIARKIHIFYLIKETVSRELYGVLSNGASSVCVMYMYI